MDHLHRRAPRTARRPRWLAALVALVAALFLAGGLSVPAQAAAAKTTLEVSVSDSSVSSGASATVTATLKRGTRALGGVHVTVQKRTAGSPLWTTITKAKTNSKGKVSTRVSGLRKDTEIRALSSGTSKYKAAKSSTKKVKVKANQRVTVTKTSTKKPTKGAAITLSGTTSSGLEGKTVELQLQSGTTWTTVSTATVSQGNRFSVATEAGGAGKATYRVHAPATASTASATSSRKAFTVHEWFNLSSLPVVDGYEWEDGSKGLLSKPSIINGAAYANALFDIHDADVTEEDVAWAIWNLDERCTTFSSLIGIDDASAAGSKASFHTVGVQGDVSSSTLKTQTLGEAVHGASAQKKTQDISGFVVFGLQASPKSAYAAGEEGYPVFADAKVLCSSKPAA